MKKFTDVQKAIALPLIGEVWGWLFFVLALYANQWQSQANYRTVTYTADSVSEYIHLGTYLFLIAIAGFAVASVRGQTLAIRSRASLGENHSLSRAAHRFNNLAVVIALAFAAIFALANFLAAFGSTATNIQSVIVRVVDVYLPILLATGLVVYVILRAFVFRESEHSADSGEKRGLTETQKALGLGYAMPIVTTAFAIIFGLIVYDVTKTSLEVWVWVLIQAIVIAGVIQGTRFAAKARQGAVRPPRERKALAAGAAALNFVLSIVFGGVVSIMAFSYGGAAVSKLQQFPQYDSNGQIIGKDTITILPVTPTWFINDLLPALVLLGLAVVGIYWSIWARNNTNPGDESKVLEA